LSPEVVRRVESVVIDARRRFARHGPGLGRPLERITFDPARKTCATMPMSVDELASLVALVKWEFDSLLEERRAAQAS